MSIDVNKILLPIIVVLIAALSFLPQDAHATPTLTLTPNHGPIGTQFALSGSGYPVNTVLYAKFGDLVRGGVIDELSFTTNALGNIPPNTILTVKPTEQTVGTATAPVTPGNNYEVRIDTSTSVLTRAPFTVATNLIVPHSNAPYITAIVADDPIGGRAVGFANGDTITIKFSEDTNKPPAQTKPELDTLFSFSQNLGADYSGRYLNPSTLVITITDSRGATPPTVGGLTIMVRGEGNLRNSQLTSPPSTATSPPLSGCFCPFSASISTRAGGTASTTLPSGVGVALTLPQGIAGTVTISKTQASSLIAGNRVSTLGVIGNIIDVTLSNGASCVQGCKIAFTFTPEDLAASKVSIGNVRIFHDHNNDGDFKDPGETLSTTITVNNTSGFLTAKARDFFNSKFMVGGIIQITLLVVKSPESQILEHTPTIIQGASSDGSERVTMYVTPQTPASSQSLSISLIFTDANGNKIQNQNYALSARQDGTTVLDNPALHSRMGYDIQTTGLLSSSDPVDLQVTLNGQGLLGTDPATWIGPKGDVIIFHVIPEFGSITSIVLVLSIVVVVFTTRVTKPQTK